MGVFKGARVFYIPVVGVLPRSFHLLTSVALPEHRVGIPQEQTTIGIFSDASNE